MRPAVLPAQTALMLVGLMVSLPFVYPYHQYPIPTFYAEWLAFALGSAALVGLLARTSDAVVRIPDLTLGFIAAAGVLAAQAALGVVPYPERSLLGMLYLLWAGMLAWLGAHLQRVLGFERVVSRLQWFVLAAGFLVTMSGFVQYYGLHTLVGRLVEGGATGGAGMFGTIGQRNNFANYVACALATVIFLFAKGRLRTAVALLLGLPMVLALALSGSRSAWVFMLIVQGLALSIYLLGERKQQGRLLYFPLSMFAVFVACQLVSANTGWFAGPAGNAITGGDRMLQTVALTTREEGVAIRLYLIREAWSLFLQHPLLGVGYGEFAWSLFHNAPTFDGERTVLDRYSHNSLLQLLAEIGLIGTLCIFVPLLLWLARFRLSGNRLDSGWVAAIVLIEAAHSAVEFPLWHANFLGLAAFVLGLAAPGGISLASTRMRRAFVMVMLAGGVFTVAKVWDDYRGFERWYQGVQAVERGNAALTQDQVEALAQLSADSVFLPYYDLLASALIEPSAVEVDAKLALNTRAMHFFPVPDAAFRQMLLLALQGREQASRLLLERIDTIYPARMPEFLARLDQLARDNPAAFAGLALDAHRRHAQKR